MLPRKCNIIWGNADVILTAQLLFCRNDSKWQLHSWVVWIYEWRYVCEYTLTFTDVVFWNYCYHIVYGIYDREDILPSPVIIRYINGSFAENGDNACWRWYIILPGLIKSDQIRY